MLPVKRTSGFGMPPPVGLQKLDPEFESHTTMRKKPIAVEPMVTVEDAGGNTVTAANTIGNAIVSSTPTPSDQRVERSETNFVHSESKTRDCVRRDRSVRRGIETGNAVLLMPPAPRSRRA